MKYPYIAINKSNVEMLVFSESKAIILSETNKGLIHDVHSAFSRHYTNITNEYLQNTWGVVESKEHAEFIIELAKLHGFKTLSILSEKYPCCFGFDDDEVYFVDNYHSVSSDTEKQITIPLPPKAKEWPQVNDEVATSAGSGFVMMMPDKHGNFVVDIKGFHHLLTIDELAKPKSKQDLLIEELQTKLCNNNAVDDYMLACDIINGEIEGLSYEADDDFTSHNNEFISKLNLSSGG